MTEHPGGRPEPAPDAPARTATESTSKSPSKSTSKSPSKTAAKTPHESTAKTTARTRIGGVRPGGGDRTGGTRAGPALRGWRRLRDAIATAVLIAAVTVAIILAVHIVFVVFEANGANGIVKTINGWASSLAWSFKDVFTPANPKTAALVNYGLAAVIYLIAGRIVAGLIRRVG